MKELRLIFSQRRNIPVTVNSITDLLINVLIRTKFFEN